jgi:hypothetical protein
MRNENVGNYRVARPYLQHDQEDANVASQLKSTWWQTSRGNSRHSPAINWLSIGFQIGYKPINESTTMHDGWTKMRAASSFWVDNTHLSATAIQYFLPPFAISSCNSTTCYFFINEQIASSIQKSQSSQSVIVKVKHHNH